MVRRLKKRDERAFAEMVGLYQSRVFAVVYRMLGDRAEAEDVAQEVFVTVFKSVDRFRGEAAFSTWLFRIATNHARNRIKYHSRRHRKKQESIDESYEVEFTRTLSDRQARPDAVAEAMQTEVAIQEALRALDDSHREVIVLRDLERLPYHEIAAVLNVAEGTVKSRLFRARAALRQELIKRCGDDIIGEK